jgi:TfoX/Sxy family transcriptional regulator of competence genes
MMQHDPKRLQSLMQAAAPDLELAFRPMFGGIMGYANGMAFASLSDVGLALKVTRQDQAELGALEGAKPLRYAPDQPPSKTYIVVPDAMLADPAGLRHWIGRSAANLKPAKKARSRKSV